MTEADPARGRRSIDDSIDLARLHARDRKLLTTLVRDLSPRIRAATRRYARSDEDAHELLQDCWVQILDRLDAFKHRGSFTAWAIAVSRNVGRTRLRRSRRGRKRTVALDDVAELVSMSEQQLGQIEGMTDDDVATLLRIIEENVEVVEEETDAAVDEVE